MVGLLPVLRVHARHCALRQGQVAQARRSHVPRQVSGGSATVHVYRTGAQHTRYPVPHFLMPTKSGPVKIQRVIFHVIEIKFNFFLLLLRAGPFSVGYGFGSW